MNREQKKLVVNTLTQDFKDSKAAFLVILKGIPVSKIQELRKGLKGKAKLKVAKNRLAKIAVQNISCAQDLSIHLKEQLGIVFSKNDITSVAKILFDFSKTNEKFEVVAGCVESKFVKKDSIEYIATLPSKEILLAQLCGTLNAPIIKLVQILNAPTMQLLLVLKQIEKQKS